MAAIFLKILQGLKQRGIQTLLLLTLYVCFASCFPAAIHQLFYTISLFIKDLLHWMMPLTICFFIAHTIQSFERKAPLFVLILICFEAFSNLSSVWYAFFSAHTVADYLPTFQATSLQNEFQALWRLPLTRPGWWSADKGAFLGLLLGGITAFGQGSSLSRIINQGKSVMEWILTRVFARLIPLFVLGFAAQMQQTKLLTHVFNHYTVMVIWLTLFLVAYIVFLFALGAGWSFNRMMTNIKSLLPAGGASFTSGCSLSTMPWTIEGTAKTLRNPNLAKALIPATTNIQQVGDCIIQAFLCFLIYQNFKGHAPDLMTWLQFSVVFTCARFATSAVLGGAIFIMLPIYETYLDFNGEMIALILALNVVLDPLVTSCNVMANGALCRTFEWVWNHVQAFIGRTRPSNLVEEDKISPL